MTDPDAGAIVWAMFTKAVAATEAGQRDEEIESFADATLGEIGMDGIAEGWAEAAHLLLGRLQEHAADLECDCGSVEWMKRVQADLVEGDDDG